MSLTNTYKEKYAECLDKTKETGFVEEVKHPVVYVNGLPNARLSELVYFESGCMGVVTSLLDDYVEIMVFSSEAVSVGTQVSRSAEILQIPVGEGLLGGVLNSLGESLYENKVIVGIEEHRSIDSVPPTIDMRQRISVSMETGVSMVDFLIPLGKGQRELIIGDRNTGKTTFVLQTLMSQAKLGTICIYAAIGKKKHSIKKIEEQLKNLGLRDRVIIVGSASSDPIGYIYLTPYTAMTIAEYFRDKGKDVLVILDDLSTHAKYYRELSLISKKFPGRDSYPGDVFYAHSRLLERAGNFKIGNNKAASITCLPLAEAIEGDITGYIQTNLMSITDGHIFFDQAVYREGKRPAINYFLSVTRVGRQTQNKVRWGINRELSSFFYLHSKTERFIHFGAELNEGIKSTLEMGKRLNQFFDQTTEEIYSTDVQIVLFVLIWSGVLREETQGKIGFYKSQAQKLYDKDPVFKGKVKKLIDSCEDFNQLLGKISAQHKEIIDYLEKVRP
ncbi:MAG: F0F1 ATP synthase subunit alpha [Patescibacteria group bacterium]